MGDAVGNFAQGLNQGLSGLGQNIAQRDQLRAQQSQFDLTQALQRELAALEASAASARLAEDARQFDVGVEERRPVNEANAALLRSQGALAAADASPAALADRERLRGLGLRRAEAEARQAEVAVGEKRLNQEDQARAFALERERLELDERRAVDPVEKGKLAQRLATLQVAQAEQQLEQTKALFDTTVESSKASLEGQRIQNRLTAAQAVEVESSAQRESERHVRELTSWAVKNELTGNMEYQRALSLALLSQQGASIENNERFLQQLVGMQASRQLTQAQVNQAIAGYKKLAPQTLKAAVAVQDTTLSLGLPDTLSRLDNVFKIVQAANTVDAMKAPEKMMNAITLLRKEQEAAVAAKKETLPKEAPGPDTEESQYGPVVQNTLGSGFPEAAVAGALRSVGVDPSSVEELTEEQGDKAARWLRDNQRKPVVYSTYEKAFVELPKAAVVLKGLTPDQGVQADILLGKLLLDRSLGGKKRSAAKTLDEMWVAADRTGWSGASGPKTTQSIAEMIRFLVGAK